MDYNLPGMSGMEILKRIKELNADICHGITFCTGKA